MEIWVRVDYMQGNGGLKVLQRCDDPLGWGRTSDEVMSREKVQE